MENANGKMQANYKDDSYQFFRTRVVIRAAITMMRDTVMVMIWCTANPGMSGEGKQP